MHFIGSLTLLYYINNILIGYIYTKGWTTPFKYRLNYIALWYLEALKNLNQNQIQSRRHHHHLSYFQFSVSVFVGASSVRLICKFWTETKRKISVLVHADRRWIVVLKVSTFRFFMFCFCNKYADCVVWSKWNRSVKAISAIFV